MEEFIPSDWVSSQSLIKVIGVGGGGSNAVSQMYRDGIRNVDFLVCNTDAQSLAQSPVPQKLQLGQELTRGRGAGCNPEIARQAALESEEKIRDLLQGGTEMVFVTAGMGGGTGTGAAPVIARIAKDLGILTVAVVTLPFRDEGFDFLKRALDGIHELEQHVDSLLIVDNEKLYKVFGELTIFDAFPHADNVLSTAVKGIAEIVSTTGFINVDFADVRMVMQDSGMALMGSGEASGDNRAVKAVEAAFASPLLNDADLSKSCNVLVNISSGAEKGITMSELSQIMDYIKEYTGNVANFKRGVVRDDSLGDAVHITIVATGYSLHTLPIIHSRSQAHKVPTVDLRSTGDAPEDQALSLGGEILDPPLPLTHSPQAERPEPMPQLAVDRKPAWDPEALARVQKKDRPALVVEVGEDLAPLENIPAYVRRQQAARQAARTPEEAYPTEEMSPVPLHLRDTAQGTALETDNSYIYQNQD